MSLIDTANIYTQKQAVCVLIIQDVADQQHFIDTWEAKLVADSSRG